MSQLLVNEINSYNGSTVVINGVTIDNGVISATTYVNIGSEFTGGTVTGPTTFSSGLTATTISATTYLNTPYWASGSTGNYSIKAKNDSGLDATGDYSHAEGFQTTASGVASHAEGIQTIASGVASHAEGQVTTASGNTSHAEGFQTTASGVASHAEGQLTIASGDFSHAEGQVTIASGVGSHAQGRQTTASGNFSHAEGLSTTASGAASHAEGYQTIASGVVGHAEGYQTTASGPASHSGGLQTTASGQNSFVHGSGSTASGTNSVVLGGGITGTTDNTVFVPYLNVKFLSGGTSVNNLGVDADGYVVSGNGGLSGPNYIFVPTSTNDPSTNGTNLTTAYMDAITKTPNGLPLSESNRYTVLLAPGVYNLPQPLTASTEYVDLVSMTGEKDVFLSASTTPLLVLTDNIKLVGINVQSYDLTILYELSNVIVENSGNNIYTIQRDTSKETKNYYFAWSRTSGEPYPLASTNGLVTYLNVDNSTYENTNKKFTFTINGFVRVKDMGYSLGTLDGSGEFYYYGQLGQTIIYQADYESLTGGALNVGDSLLFSGGASPDMYGELVYDDGVSIALFTLTSGSFYSNHTQLTNQTNGATATITGLAQAGYGLDGNGDSSINVNSTISNGNLSSITYQATPGLNSFAASLEPNAHAFVVFSGNPGNSFISDSYLSTVTNNLGGTAQIVVNTGTNVLYLQGLSGTWIGATTITGDVSSDTRNIVKFSDTLELNVKTELTFTGVETPGYTLNTPPYISLGA